MTKLFMKDKVLYHGICFTNKDVKESMEYEFADFIVDNIKIMTQLSFGTALKAVFGHSKIAFDQNHQISQTIEEIEKTLEVMIVQSGTSFDNHDGTWTHDYEGTLYLFHNDWLMCDGKKLFVVDEEHIKEFTELKKVDINA